MATSDTTLDGWTGCPEPLPQQIIELYDEYTHVPLKRRDFIKRLVRLAGGSAAAYAMLPLLENNYAQAAEIAPDDPRVRAESVTYPGAGTQLHGYLARPADATGKLPGIIVIHENRGLNPHIQDVVRRLAVKGYLAVGPDLLSPLGGTPADEDKAREMIGALDRGAALASLQATLRYLEHDPRCTGKVGCVGFCWGGGMTNELAAHAPSLAAAVAYYGRSPELSAVADIKAPLLLQYAGLDQRINAGATAYVKALQAARKPYVLYTYEGAQHAFNNDTNPARYNAAAAKLAWGRTLAFFDKHLKKTEAQGD